MLFPKTSSNRSEDPKFGGWRIGMQVPYLSGFFSAKKESQGGKMSESTSNDIGRILGISGCLGCIQPVVF